MIAIDTSSLIAYFKNFPGDDITQVDSALEQGCAVFPPVVLCEMLSDHKLSSEVVQILRRIPLLPVSTGYWERGGFTRAKLISRGLKARLADTLIAQSCIDNDVPLITRDDDFRHYARYSGLRLL